LKPAQREELAAHLQLLRLVDHPAWKREMARRMRDMDRGRKVTQAQLEHMLGMRKRRK
jgi:hypothetical protein